MSRHIESHTTNPAVFSWQEFVGIVDGSQLHESQKAILKERLEKKVKGTGVSVDGFVKLLDEAISLLREVGSGESANDFRKFQSYFVERYINRGG